MTCAETRQYLFAFLDSELDTPLSIELQRHLDGCPECAREAEIERTINKRLGQVIEAGGPVASAFSFDGTMLKTHAPRYGTRTSRWRPLLAAAAALAILVGGAWWSERQGEPPAPEAAAMSDQLAADFGHFLDEGQTVQIASADRARVTDWLREKTALAVVLPADLDPGCRLVGGRKCKIANQPAAFAVYDLDGEPASLVIVAHRDGDLDSFERVVDKDDAYLVNRAGGFTIVARRCGELTCAAVAQLPEEKLLCLVSGAVHESD